MCHLEVLVLDDKIAAVDAYPLVDWVTPGLANLSELYAAIPACISASFVLQSRLFGSLFSALATLASFGIPFLGIFLAALFALAVVFRIDRLIQIFAARVASVFPWSDSCFYYAVTSFVAIDTAPFLLRNFGIHRWTKFPMVFGLHILPHTTAGAQYNSRPCGV